MSKFLLLLGVSGVGKSSIIEELTKLDSRFVYISPYMTRPLRDGEKNKIPITNEQMDEMWKKNELLAINELYGIRYATPRLPIIQALNEKNFPVLDWPISKIRTMRQAFPNQLYVVYIVPPSIEVLQQRLKDGRDKDGSRLINAKEELSAYWASQYKGCYDFEIVSEVDQIIKVAQAIYKKYIA
ncbi:hypothetical protein L6250_01035 [Candidatus Parcubacteria bacterium]|nr:hypothetical protein [Candidatus Parcubacteria bacterium]MCG2712794.1 hypothetical protein [Candidatus Omnitrophota bacterium]